jgi:hypothetical protein
MRGRELDDLPPIQGDERICCRHQPVWTIPCDRREDRFDILLAVDAIGLKHNAQPLRPFPSLLQCADTGRIVVIIEERHTGELRRHLAQQLQPLDILRSDEGDACDVCPGLA